MPHDPYEVSRANDELSDELNTALAYLLQVARSVSLNFSAGFIGLTRWIVGVEHRFKCRHSRSRSSS